MVMATALTVINSKHRSRQVFVAFQELKKQHEQLDTEWGQLQLEQATWAAHGRVEDMARKQLRMVVPSTDAIRIITQK
ncbi:MAG: cell division protein FtsL [Gammaproteobacteria bacterium]|nr:cell division protein FtsL [Gammaproteobacteria bacterium]